MNGYFKSHLEIRKYYWVINSLVSTALVTNGHSDFVPLLLFGQLSNKVNSLSKCFMKHALVTIGGFHK